MKLEQTFRVKSINGLSVLLLTLAIISLTALVLKTLYSVPLSDSVLWYIGVFICFYIPGNLILRLLRYTDDDFFSGFFLSISLGAALSPVVYINLRRISQPELLYFILAIFIIVWLVNLLKEYKDKNLYLCTHTATIAVLLLFLLVILVVAHLSYFTDIKFLQDGYRFRSTLSENSFHLGIVNSLIETFPPFYPYASGYSFSHYHIFMHLQIEMFHRLFSIDTIKLTYFYFPLLYCFLLVILPYLFIMRYWSSRILGIFAGLMVFGSDLSYVPGLTGLLPKGGIWTLFFMPVIWHIVVLNGILPAFFIMFLCLIFMKEFFEKGHWGAVLVFSLLVYSAYGFKSSMGFHIAGAALLTGVVAFFFTDSRKKPVFFTMVSLIILILLSVDLALIRGGAGRPLSLQFFEPLKQTLKILGIKDASLLLCFILFPVYVLACFGGKIPGIYLLKGVFTKKYFDPVIFFLLVYTLAGFVLPEIVYIVSPSAALDNAANFFTIQSLAGANILLACFFLRMDLPNKKLYIALSLIILISLPSTLQFLRFRFNSDYFTVDHEAMEVVRYLEKVPLNSVIMHPLNSDGPSLASNLSGRQSVIAEFCSFAPDWIEADAYTRANDIGSFFDTKEHAVNRSGLLKKYNVDYVYAPLSYGELLDKENMLRGKYQNREYVVYEVIK